jgi:hypothetical protein
LPDVLHRPLLGQIGRHHTSWLQGKSDAVVGRAEVGRRRRSRSGDSHRAETIGGTVGTVGDLFDIENLLPELIIALGLALVIGNGLAWWKNRKGETPAGVTDATYRRGRVVWLTGVGLLLTVWGLVTLLN